MWFLLMTAARSVGVASQPGGFYMLAIPFGAEASLLVFGFVL